MKATTTEVQNNFGHYLKICQHEKVVITKNGREVAELMGVSEVREDAPVYMGRGVPMSYQQFQELARSSEKNYEYIDGEVFLLTSPLYPHQRAVREIFGEFIAWFRDKNCEPLVSPFDITLYRKGYNEKVSVVQPDILVICDSEKIDDTGKYRGTPALLVEVLSISTRSIDLLKKLDLYMESGVQEYWIVDPSSQQVIIYCFQDYQIITFTTLKHKDAAESIIFPGLKVRLEQIFPN